MNSANHRVRYHHGDLRRTLLAFALRRVRAGGAAEFSLREAARAAGVTGGAVYKHFENKDALLGAVAAEGFRLFSDRMAKASMDLKEAERLRATGRSYIAFASREPHLFRLMFSGIGTCVVSASQGSHTPSDDPPGPRSSYEQLREAMAEVAGIAPDAVDPGLLALAWSAAHGAASLICEGVWRRNDPRAEAAIDKVVRVVIETREQNLLKNRKGGYK
jgi:AcrR family transcriptional regulator